jgi:hypothetical protein
MSNIELAGYREYGTLWLPEPVHDGEELQQQALLYPLAVNFLLGFGDRDHYDELMSLSAVPEPADNEPGVAYRRRVDAWEATRPAAGGLSEKGWLELLGITPTNNLHLLTIPLEQPAIPIRYEIEDEIARVLLPEHEPLVKACGKVTVSLNAMLVTEANAYKDRADPWTVAQAIESTNKRWLRDFYATEIFTLLEAGGFSEEQLRAAIS